MFKFLTSDSIPDFLDKIDVVEGVTVILLDPVAFSHFIYCDYLY